jgi:hypothetical protein
VGLFRRRRASTEDLVREHLERSGVSAFWLQSALDALRLCESGQPFEPVFSIAGPAPARSVIALMNLEPFLRGEIDWSISPSESPLWVGAVGHFDEGLFDATTERFRRLYSSTDNPTIRPDVERALRDMRDALQAELSPKLDFDEAASGLWALGSAGYVWRVAEGPARISRHLRADVVKEVEAVVASIILDGADDHFFGRAATEVVRRNLLLEAGSPGGWATGGEFLRRGFRFADELLWPDADVPRSRRWDAFLFGVALYEVDECLARRPAWSRQRKPSSAVRG